MKAWAIAWLTVGLLAICWFILAQLAPVCTSFPRYACGLWTDAGVVVIGIAVLGLAVLVAIAISIWSLWRGGFPVLAGAMIFLAVMVLLSVIRIP